MPVPAPSRTPVADKILFGLTTMCIVSRAVAAAALPLMGDEYYYWLWAQRLDWSYLDHPPMIAYAVYLTTLGGDGTLWVRLGPLLFGVATSYVLFLLGRDMFDRRAGLIAAAVYQITPALFNAGFLAVPDAPLSLAWTVALRELWHALHDQPRRWTTAGVALGLGLLSKFYIAFLGVGVAVFLMLHARRWLAHPAPYGAALLALALFSPVVYWNLTHDWAMVRFVMHERPGGVQPGLPGVGAILLQQVGALLTLFPVFVWAIWSAWRRGADPRFAYLLWTALPALLFPLVLAGLDGRALGHWLYPGYLGLSVALGALVTRILGILAAAAAVSAALFAYGVAVVVFPSLPPIPGLLDHFGWDAAATRVRQELAGLGPRAVIVADRYEVGAALVYHTRGTIPVTVLPAPNPASIWPPPATFRGANAVAVLDAGWTSDMKWRCCFSRVEEAAPLYVTFRGRALRTFRIFRLYDLRVEGNS